MLVFWFRPQIESPHMIEWYGWVSQFSFIPYVIIEHLPVCHNLISLIGLIHIIPLLDSISYILLFDLISHILWSGLIIPLSWFNLITLAWLFLPSPPRVRWLKTLTITFQIILFTRPIHHIKYIRTVYPYIPSIFNCSNPVFPRMEVYPKLGLVSYYLPFAWFLL